MNEFTEFKIGRKNASIVLDDAGVSALHAELVVAHDGFFLTDCSSTNGTFVEREGKWHRIRQAFVDPSEKLKFGTKTVILSALCNSAGIGTGQGSGSKQSAKPGLGGPTRHEPKDDLPEGDVYRNDKGEVVSKNPDR